eukprot:3616714-Alexandrium_andersonii.AAC.1
MTLPSRGVVPGSPEAIFASDPSVRLPPAHRPQAVQAPAIQDLPTPALGDAGWAAGLAEAAAQDDTPAPEPAAAAAGAQAASAEPAQRPADTLREIAQE